MRAATWRERRVPTNGMVLHCLEAGEEGEPLVVLLHGFPDCAHSWRFQGGALAAEGYHVVAPNLRGYDGSSRPQGVEAYQVREIATDIAELIPALRASRAALVVGHDWGGVTAWRLALEHGALVERLGILNAPHPVLMARALTRNPGQMIRSLYALFFQLPVLPELLLRAGGLRLVRRAIASRVRAGTFLPEDWGHIESALGARGALTAALNYYRAAGRRRKSGALARESPAAARAVPGVVVWGERDPFLSPSLLAGLGEVAPRMCVVRVPWAGHWVHWDAPGQVTEALLGVLREPG